jgi:hypothetical protein
MSADASTSVQANGRETQIAKLTVYHLSRLVFTETALTGAQLEERSDLEKFETTDRARIDETIERIDRVATTPTSDVCDARWGLVFSNAAGVRVRSFYLDRFGTTGELDGAPVALPDESLIDWLRGQYGPDGVLS